MATKEIYTVGLPNSGKRTLLSLISYTASQHPNFDVNIEKGSRVISDTTSSLMRGEWPEDAEGDIAFGLTYKKSIFKKRYRIALKEIADVNDRVSLFFAVEASGFIFVLDATKDSTEEERKLGTMIMNIKKILSGESFPPSVIAVTKCDVMDIGEPKAWVEENYPIFAGEIKAKAARWNTYPVKIYTENDRPAKPLMVEGPGMILSWIADRVR